MKKSYLQIQDADDTDSLRLQSRNLQCQDADNAGNIRSDQLQSQNTENIRSDQLQIIVRKAEEKFEEILQFSLSSNLKEPHRFEKILFRLLLELGGILLQIFFNSSGIGDEGGEIIADNGAVLKRYRKRRIDYISIFGKAKINRWYYWSVGNSGIFPLDESLNLPERVYSYYLQELIVRDGADLTYEKSLDRIENLFGVNLSPRSMMDILQDTSRHADKFRDGQSPPPSDDEGEILVVSADGKGVPMRKECLAKKKCRLKKGEKNQKKKMSMVTAVYTIDRNVRTADDILDEAKSSDSPRPCHKRIRGRLGDKSAKGELLGKVMEEAAKRDWKGKRQRVFLSDGERFIRGLQKKYFPGYIVVLDIFHVTERLWDFSHCFHREGSKKAKDYVNLLYRMLLEGNVFGCIQAMKFAAELPGISKSRRKTIREIINYFDGNQDRMRYDEYIRKGIPIGSGVVESTCKVLVQQRMEGSGMRWSKPGADAMLALRAIYLNGDLGEYFEYHIENERKRLYDDRRKWHSPKSGQTGKRQSAGSNNQTLKPAA